MQEATLVFLVRGDPPAEILLGWKKNGFGSSKYNGFGGKIEINETIQAAAVRELREEAGIDAAIADLTRVARLEFYFPAKPEWNQVVHVFIVRRWRGEPVETREMKPLWCRIDAIPFDRMWADDADWLPRILSGERVEATFTFKADNETVDTMSLRDLPA
jgi:mutator protein MutT